MSLEQVITDTVQRALQEALSPLLAAQQAPKRLAYTIREAAEVTGASEWHIRTAITSGELHAKQAGEGRTGRYIIPADCLTAWLHDTPQPITVPARSGVRQRMASGQR